MRPVCLNTFLEADLSDLCSGIWQLTGPDMLMDADDYNDQMTDHQDVAIIAPQHLDDDVLEEHEPLADDCTLDIPWAPKALEFTEADIMPL